MRVLEDWDEGELGAGGEGGVCGLVGGGRRRAVRGGRSGDGDGGEYRGRGAVISRVHSVVIITASGHGCAGIISGDSGRERGGGG